MNWNFKKIVPHFLLATMMVNAFGYASAGMLPKSVLLCTSQGYKWVSVEDDSDSLSHNPSCEFCLAPSNDGEDCVDNNSELSNTSITNQQFVAIVVGSLTASSKYLLAQGRAPPFYYSLLD